MKINRYVDAGWWEPVMMWLFNKSLSMDLILSLGDKHYLIKTSLDFLLEDIRLFYLIGHLDLDLIKMIHYYIWTGLSSIWPYGHYYKVLETQDIHMPEACWTYVIHISLRTTAQYCGHALEVHI